MRNQGKWLGGIAAAATLFMARTQLASAQMLQNPINCPGGSSGGACFASILNSFLGFLFWDIVSPLCAIMVLVGAFQMITSSGNPEKFSQGRKTILYAAIGFVVALIAGGITSFIKSLFNVQ